MMKMIVLAAWRTGSIACVYLIAALATASAVGNDTLTLSIINNLEVFPVFGAATALVLWSFDGRAE